MTTTTDLAVRDHGTAAQSVPAGALAIEDGQTAWTPMQAAAFGQLGIADAPEGDKQVLLHISQRTGLDPFARQLYMIGRKEKKSVKRGGRWEEEWSVKWGIQTGIEGFRVIRSRAERAEGVRGILSRPVYYNGKGERFDVWFFNGVPIAVEMTYTVRDRSGVETPYTSILRFDEYRQTRKETRDGVETQVLSGQWATKPTHMLEKCCEADVYRKAFPQDYSGVALEDAMPPVDWDSMSDEELDARARAVGYRDRPPVTDLRQRAAAQTVTAGQARGRATDWKAETERLGRRVEQQRAAETAAATVVTPDTSPAQPAAPPAGSAGEDPTPSPQASSPAGPGQSPEKTPPPSGSSPSGSGAARVRDGSDSPGTVTDPQLTAIGKILGNVYGYAKEQKEEVRAVCARIVEHELKTTTMLSFNEAGQILDSLDLWRREAADAAAGPRAYLDLMTGQGDPRDEDGTTADA